VLPARDQEEWIRAAAAAWPTLARTAEPRCSPPSALDAGRQPPRAPPPPASPDGAEREFAAGEGGQGALVRRRTVAVAAPVPVAAVVTVRGDSGGDSGGGGVGARTLDEGGHGSPSQSRCRSPLEQRPRGQASAPAPVTWAAAPALQVNGVWQIWKLSFEPESRHPFSTKEIWRMRTGVIFGVPSKSYPRTANPNSGWF
jgi:hypothetical protein